MSPAPAPACGLKNIAKEFGVSGKQVMASDHQQGDVPVVKNNQVCITRINNPRTVVMLPLLPAHQTVKDNIAANYLKRTLLLIFLGYPYFSHSCTKAPAAHPSPAGRVVAAWSLLLCTLPECWVAAGQITVGSSSGRNGCGKRCILLPHTGITHHAHYSATDPAPPKAGKLQV